MTNSIQKGKRGEREAAKALSELGIASRRGQQFSGSPDSPDVLTSLEWAHFEVKRVEQLNIYKAMDQATADSGGKTPIVMHRRNGKDWLITLRLDDFGKLALTYGSNSDK